MLTFYSKNGKIIRDLKLKSKLMFFHSYPAIDLIKLLFGLYILELFIFYARI